ncbi:MULTISPECIES: pyruvate, phosphate dikinase [unclassified Novosphingobium]|uniref:pyruvate, phosphate dikinase n=1 Tax=unclassified Novosphingobium TaxID=2644732 RepID=UPI00086DCEAC|nr:MULTISPECIES: pyruvate, phosphate dikinase [unclassified Novosphingobium]MBN9143491.1 pyruvate, phosphate dikinase [Novosphingobium sp.]MDR6706740.1 pyruvate,orthophosphate dikinase [Novosphingobium sp. 1748]ODU83740.1 MAG: pyruvate, phosphate dikinase [Novosphingobium sp. SCN 63-17]OJX92679.1 MAG: pyruvate, phosphate dikinase [Novosphingobium sp. 63-713]
MSAYVFYFGGGANSTDPRSRDKTIAGGKGANLAEMAGIGLPVPPGFTISTEVCATYNANGKSFDADLRAGVAAGVAHVESSTGRVFGDTANPLLVSVRSGARVSMPGMMDTVLNLGLNDETVQGLAQGSGNPRFAWDSYRRFIQMYSDVVLGIDHHLFEDALEIVKEDNGFYADVELEAEHWQALVGEYKEIVEKALGRPFPQDVHEQLWGAIGAVFDSWESERAKVYRRLNDIPGDWGTAVNVQAMVFGNMGDTSATGVAFTRDPATGEKAYYGEWLVNAQGEDVVAGIRTPQYLTKFARERAGAKPLSMEEAMPEAYTELAAVFELLEKHYKDMQDIEFTVERNKLWMLQTRSGKRTAKAALKMAVDMVGEGLIDEATAIKRVDPMALDQLLHPTLDPKAERDYLGKGLPASPGAASGAIVLDAETAQARAERGDSVILVRVETSPEDIHGMHAAKGILTARGGMTSHAAVVARGMGRPCVSGASAVSIDMNSRTLKIGTRDLKEGDIITLDGATGDIMGGAVPTIEPELVGDFGTLMVWADKHRRMKVRTNAETPEDCRTARSFGAEGIGLCRTEHMFFDAGRISAVRQMILAEDEDGRRAALAKLLPEQRADFHAIFEIMAGLPVTIRLLDPPLHEFLPHGEAEFAELSDAIGIGVETLKRRAGELHEFNPMLGHRGCRLGITFPEIYEMQARAIFEAAVDVALASGEAVVPEVMIPLVATKKELSILKALVDRTAAQVFAEKGKVLDYLVGTMIELPRAALMAGEIAEEAKFFSFGTNDLTQTTLGVSRDDAARFLSAYVEQGIYARDPFVSLDVEGVGQLVELAAERGRKTLPGIKLGICGEHGGDPASIAFCEKTGLDYVSASPFRVPIARLAAAQAALG